MNISIICKIIISLLIILISAIFSTAEGALSSSKRSTIRKSIENKKDDFLCIWLENPAKISMLFWFIRLILIIICTSTSIIASCEIAKELSLSPYITIPVAMILVLISFLILGRGIPNGYGYRNSSYIIPKITPVLNLTLVLIPIANFLLWLSKWGNKPADKDNIEESTEDKLHELVSSSEGNGVFDEERRDMIHNILEFEDITVKDIMVPRVDIVAVDVNTPLEQILDTFSNKKFSRLPVYEGNIDNITGVLYVKDLLNAWRMNKKEMSAVEFIRIPLFVPETKKINELFREFRLEKTMMAIVVDEYGSTVGLITMEDLLEEIVGEIHDEHEEPKKQFKKISDNVYEIDGKMNIESANEELGINLPTEEDFETVGGFILKQLGKIPSPDEKLEYNGIRITVSEVKKHSVSKVRIEKLL